MKIMKLKKQKQKKKKKKKKKKEMEKKKKNVRKRGEASFASLESFRVILSHFKWVIKPGNCQSAQKQEDKQSFMPHLFTRPSYDFVASFTVVDSMRCLA